MKEPTYRQTLAHAWSLVWQNKMLWIFGLLSVFIGQLGFSDVFGKIWSFFDASLSAEGFSLLPIIKLDIYGGVWSILGLVWFAIICFSILALVGFLAVTAQGSLVYYAGDWFKNGKHQTMHRAWGVAIKHFWSIAAVNIIKQVLTFALLFLFVYVAGYFFRSDSLGYGFLFAAVCAVACIALLVLSCLSVYALCYVVLDGKGLVASLRKSWELFSEHVLVSLEIGMLLVIINVLLVAAILAGAFLAFLPAVLIWIAGGIANLVVFATIGFATGMLLLLLFIAFIAGIFNAFTISAWVFLFMKMHREGISSRTVHLLKYVFSR